MRSRYFFGFFAVYEILLRQGMAAISTRRLASVTASSRLSIHDSSKVQCSSNNFISRGQGHYCVGTAMINTFDVPDTREILSSATPDQHDTVLLQIVSLTLDVRRHRLPGTQFYSGDFPFGGIGFFWFPNEKL